MKSNALVNAGEMYLKPILELEEEGVPAMRARLVERFEHSGPTVSQTVARLSRNGYIDLRTDRRLALTAVGRNSAEAVMRKHRLAEVFLFRVVGLGWEFLHLEACRWEHVMSDRVGDLLDGLLNHPHRTPYGNPIAPSDGTVPDDVCTSVSKLTHPRAPGASPVAGTLEWIGEPLQADPVSLRLLSSHGLLPGTSISFTTHGDGVLVRATEGRRGIVIPPAIAAHLFARSAVDSAPIADGDGLTNCECEQMRLLDRVAPGHRP